MAQDCAGSDAIPLTQEFLGHMLGTSRKRISDAAGELQDVGCIRQRHGLIRILEPAWPFGACLRMLPRDCRTREGRRRRTANPGDLQQRTTHPLIVAGGVCRSKWVFARAGSSSVRQNRSARKPV
jgi:hypothetical protein